MYLNKANQLQAFGATLPSRSELSALKNKHWYSDLRPLTFIPHIIQGLDPNEIKEYKNKLVTFNNILKELYEGKLETNHHSVFIITNNLLKIFRNRKLIDEHDEFRYGYPFEVTFLIGSICAQNWKDVRSTAECMIGTNCKFDAGAYWARAVATAAINGKYTTECWNDFKTADRLSGHDMDQMDQPFHHKWLMLCGDSAFSKLAKSEEKSMDNDDNSDEKSINNKLIPDRYDKYHDYSSNDYDYSDIASIKTRWVDKVNFLCLFN
eukprot:123510_1